jgi:hypothetical protein
LADASRAAWFDAQGDRHVTLTVNVGLSEVGNGDRATVSPRRGVAARVRGP